MPRYALHGSDGSPCTDNPVTGEHEHHYGSPGTYGIEFDKPIPVDLQREWDRRESERASVARAEVFVTDHGRPKWEPYDADPMTANARRLVRVAEAAGFEVKVITTPERCTVEGLHREKRCGFRSSWLRGSADFGTWHAPYRSMMVKDDRPIRIDKVDRVALKNARGAGFGDVRIITVATPRGLSVGVTEVERRVKEMGE